MLNLISFLQVVEMWMKDPQDPEVFYVGLGICVEPPLATPLRSYGLPC